MGVADLSLLRSILWDSSQVGVKPALKKAAHERAAVICVPTREILNIATTSGPGLIACSLDSRKTWSDERQHDALILNQFLVRADSDRVQGLMVALPSDVELQDSFDDLEGFNLTSVYANVDDFDVEDATAHAAERPWLSLSCSCGHLEKAGRTARFIVLCSGLEVPFSLHGLSGVRFTKGLQVGTLNLALAALLAFTEELSVTEVEKVLVDQNPLNFIIEPERLGWNSWTADAEALEEARTILKGIGIRDLTETFALHNDLTSGGTR